MATISAATGGGNWSNTATWNGGVVPNLAVDDVVISGPPPRTVTIQATDILTMTTGRTITVGTTSTLLIQGSLDVVSGATFNSSTSTAVTIASGGVLTVEAGSTWAPSSINPLTVQNGGFVYIVSSTTAMPVAVNAGGILDVGLNEAARNTDPGVGNVLTGHDYKILNVAKTATLTLPANGTKVLTSESAFGIAGNSVTPSATLPTASHVLNDQTYGVAGNGSTGTLTLPANGNTTLLGTNFGVAGTSITGTVTLPLTAYVRSGVTYGPSLSLAGADVLPAQGDVRAGVTYGFIGEFTGSLIPGGGTPTGRVIGG
jgi:hypothetical protein